MCNSKLNDESGNFFGAEKKNIYAVPDHFFEKLENDIHCAVEAKKISAPRRTNRWLELSIAAAIISIVCFSGIFLMKDRPDMNNEDGLILYNLFYCELE